VLLGKAVYASEQDAVLGAVNRRFARFFKKIFLATPLLTPLPPSIMGKCSLVGMPLRASIQKRIRHTYSLPEENEFIRMTVIGGSQGASVFSEVVPQAIIALSKALKKRLCIFHQCRAADIDCVKAIYEQEGIQANVQEFFAEMGVLLAQTHLMISRSGASSVAEVIAMSVPTIFVPYPYATHDHQTANARLLDQQGAAWLVPQVGFNVSRCFALLDDLLKNPQKLLFASERLKLFSKKNTTSTLASEILSV
jgi:UDP-N-acetylglucosamine--N-acetylmuramyl-(pentapeptide) pyrophosphoryl-undecaprenol N-acetylglucosamine transferase